MNKEEMKEERNKLRGMSWEELQIALPPDLVEVVAMYNFYCDMAKELGIEPDE